MLLNNGFWVGRKVLITGHTGFKGTWLSLLLSRMGAHVVGVSLTPDEASSQFFLAAGVDSIIASNNYLDIRDDVAINALFQKEKPQVIFHLAAQAYVRESYRDPVNNWTTNILGSINIMEAIRKINSVEALVFVTSDKCYENKEWLWGYREIDPLGGLDPYSASKACSEILANSYRHSFFKQRNIQLATARAGNVIGGGDYSTDRLVPDIFRAIDNFSIMQLRNPNSTRPWQHVLDALSGYILLAGKLINGEEGCAQAFNFGPEVAEVRSVLEVLNCFKSEFQELEWQISESSGVHEAANLSLDSSKAMKVLGWKPRWGFAQSIEKTIEWHKEVKKRPGQILEITYEQINSYIENNEKRTN